VTDYGGKGMETSKEHVRNIYEYVKSQYASQSNAIMQKSNSAQYAFLIVSIALPIIASLIPAVANLSRKIPVWAMVILVTSVIIVLLLLFITALLGVWSLTPVMFAVPSMRKKQELLILQQSENVNGTVLLKQLTSNYIKAFDKNEAMNKEVVGKKARLQKSFAVSFVALIFFSVWFFCCTIFFQ
jgi:hypothetical protein